MEFDVCVIGSGAGGGSVASALAQAGASVVVLEKGPWLRDGDFFKDEVAAVRRSRYVPDRRSEPHVVETYDEDEGWQAETTEGTGWDFWNGSLVGGASNLMSGFFHRLKPEDFRLLSEFGPIPGANVADWPISYDDLEPWYTLVETAVGVSGRARLHPLADRRSTPDFPLPPLAEHPLADWLDRACAELGLHATPVPRAVLSRSSGVRNPCSYTGFCGDYGCATGAKGSSRAALLGAAVASGSCAVRAEATAQRLVTNARGQITHVEYRNKFGALHKVTARFYVVACQAIETARLLLRSTGPRHPAGLGNSSGQVGQNLAFSTAAWARGELVYRDFSEAQRAELRHPGPWLHRAVLDHYFVRDPQTGQRRKGGLIEFMLGSPNRISAAESAAFTGDVPLWGLPLKRALEEQFRGKKRVLFEVFADWLPTPAGHVTLDPQVRDHLGQPVARVRIDKHPHNKQVADHLLAQGVAILERLGAQNVYQSSRGAPATNLPSGTCRMGADPATSVVDATGRVHDCDNLYVADASVFPTGGSVPPTWTVYALGFRLADTLVKRLGLEGTERKG